MFDFMFYLMWCKELWPSLLATGLGRIEFPHSTPPTTSLKVRSCVLFTPDNWPICSVSVLFISDPDIFQRPISEMISNRTRNLSKLTFPLLISFKKPENRCRKAHTSVRLKIFGLNDCCAHKII
jgi:hypothetical protein